ncbi:hypothetical protein ACE193_00240 [Bernardetia sp. OM2101]|uniref:hypothetical protein n=1 Tax=Bernardetia sp. OM2101 TaxID=3344876 RepID=UPI0035CF894C
MKIKIIDRKNYTISIDQIKNRVYFQMHRQVWSSEDMELFFLDWKEIIAQMQVNFTILSDIRNLQIQSPKLDKLHEDVQKYVANNGLLKVARVVSNNDIVNLQFGRIVERSFMPHNTFYTFEEAEEYLDKIVKEFQESNIKK